MLSCAKSTSVVEWMKHAAQNLKAGPEPKFLLYVALLQMWHLDFIRQRWGYSFTFCYSLLLVTQLADVRCCNRYCVVSYLQQRCYSTGHSAYMDGLQP